MSNGLTNAAKHSENEARIQKNPMYRWYAHFAKHGGLWIAGMALVLFFQACRLDFLICGEREFFSSGLPVLSGLSLSNISAAFQVPAPWDQRFGPLAVLSHMVDFQVFGSNPAAHHLTNVWLHVLNVFLVFLLVREITKRSWAAVLAAAIFGLHPLQAASVVWLSQRRILLATVFVLSCVWWWVRWRQTGALRHYAFALAAYCLAILCFPPSGMVVCIVWLMECKNGVLGGADESNPRRRFWFYSPLWIAWASATALALLKTGHLHSNPTGATVLWESVGLASAHIIEVFATFTSVLGNLLAIKPVCLTSTLDASEISGTDLGLALAGLISVWLVWRVQTVKARRVLVGLAWFICFGAAAVFSARLDALVPVQWTYLANVGLAFAIVCILQESSVRYSSRAVTPWLAVVLVLWMMWCSSTEINRWSGSEGVLQALAAKTPNAMGTWRVQQALGTYYSDQGNNTEGKKCFKLALASKFDSRTLLDLGFIEARANRFGRAKIYFEQVLRENQLPAQAHNALGLLAKEDGNLFEAARRFSLAIASDPRDATALASLAFIYACAPDAELRNGPLALDLASRALRLTENQELNAMTAAAAAFAEIGEFKEAESLAHRAWRGAIRLGDTNQVAECQLQLEFYKTHRPWRVGTQRTAPGANYKLLSVPEETGPTNLSTFENVQSDH
jgi:tetratricopeptide (TPR) repeat protein